MTDHYNLRPTPSTNILEGTTEGQELGGPGPMSAELASPAPTHQTKAPPAGGCRGWGGAGPVGPSVSNRNGSHGRAP